MSTSSIPPSPSSSWEQFTRSSHWTLVKTACLIGITALLGSFASCRFHNAGEWLPSLPDTVGVWQSTETPIDAATLGALGNPKSTARVYTNPLGEQVMASIVAAGPFENYHDPTVCMTGSGFALSSRKTFGLGDGGKVRAMVFKMDPGRLPPNSGDLRVVMYYWQQNKDGSIDTEARMGTYRDMEARFKTGYGAVVKGRQATIIRIYSYVLPGDKNGVQAQRNVDEISSAVYSSLKTDPGMTQ